MSKFCASLSICFSFNRATDTSVHAVFLVLFRDEFPLMKVQQDTHHWLRSRSLKSYVPWVAVPFLQSLKSPRAFHEGNFALTSLQSGPFLEGSASIAITMAFRFSFIFARSELSNSRRAVRLIFDASRDEVCVRWPTCSLCWSSINHPLMSCTLFINRPLTRQDKTRMRIG